MKRRIPPNVLRLVVRGLARLIGGRKAERTAREVIEAVDEAGRQPVPGVYGPTQDHNQPGG